MRAAWEEIYEYTAPSHRGILVNEPYSSQCRIKGDTEKYYVLPSSFSTHPFSQTVINLTQVLIFYEKSRKYRVSFLAHFNLY